jgi:hypothetical protein
MVQFDFGWLFYFIFIGLVCVSALDITFAMLIESLLDMKLG